MAEAEQSQANMMESVRNCLQRGDYEHVKELRRQIRKEHGYSMDKQLAQLIRENPPPPAECPDCGGSIPYEVNDMGSFYQDKCQACEYKRIKVKIANDLHEIMGLNGVPKRYWSATLEDFPAGYRKINLNRSYFVWGQRGVGKTHLLCAIYQHLVLSSEPEQHTFEGRLYPVYIDIENYHCFPEFVSAPELLLQIRSTFGNRGGGDEAEILRKYSDKPVLFIDDLGAENASDWAVSVMFLLIDRRYNNDLKTYISSNHNLNELAAHLDDRISSRIAEMCEVIKMSGSDRRLKQ
jgi:DNA replication protein DnaC